MAKAFRSKSVDYGVGEAAAQTVTGKSPVPVPPEMRNGFHHPSPTMQPFNAAGRRNTAVDFKTLPPTPTKSTKTPPPPPPVKAAAPAVQQPTAMQQFPRSLSSPVIKPPVMPSTLPRGPTRPLPEPPKQPNGHGPAATPQFRLPAATPPRPGVPGIPPSPPRVAGASLSPGNPPSSHSRFTPPTHPQGSFSPRCQVPSASPQRALAGGPPVPPPRPAGPPPSGQTTSRVQISGFPAHRGPPPALPPSRNCRPSSSSALPPSLPTGPPPPLPPPRMSSKPR